MKYILFVVVAAILLSACASTAELTKPEATVTVPPNCGSHDHIAGLLTQAVSETPLILGLSPGVVTEWYGSPDGGSWSIVKTTLSGVSCIVDSGYQWTEAESMK